MKNNNSTSKTHWFSITFEKVQPLFSQGSTKKFGHSLLSEQNMVNTEDGYCVRIGAPWGHRRRHRVGVVGVGGDTSFAFLVRWHPVVSVLPRREMGIFFFCCKETPIQVTGTRGEVRLRNGIYEPDLGHKGSWEFSLLKRLFSSTCMSCPFGWVLTGGHRGSGFFFNHIL